jgi:hypothetical protein
MAIGGLNSKKTFKLKLVSLEDNWYDGPDLHNIRHGSGCARIRRDLNSNEFSLIVAGGQNEVSMV